MRQLDVNNAFLHGFLSEDVYMTQPPGFEDASKPNYVCHLQRSLYGLKQVPRAWFHRLSSFLLSHSFNSSKTDPSLFILHNNSITLFILIYVGDIFVTGNSSSAIHALISTLSHEFSLKDLGPVHYFLGIQVIRSSHGFLLSQRQYIYDILALFNMSNAKGVQTPMSTSTSLTLDNNSTLFDATTYRQAIGAL